MQFTTLLISLLAALSSSVSAREQPDWLMSPERSGYISVVGYAPKPASGSTEAQRRIALMKARQQLGQIVRVRVESVLQQETQVKGGIVTRIDNSATRLSSHATLNLNNAEVRAQWVDPVNGDFYLLLEFPDATLIEKR